MQGIVVAIDLTTMKIQSLVSQGWSLIPIEVEVLLTRGLPDLKFVGLPDQTIKESALRIKTAIKQSEFSWPEAEQIIVNLKPNYLKKSSRGLELAVAAGILWETQQLPPPPPEVLKDWVLYGELNLDGSVHQPDDLLFVKETGLTSLLTGQSTMTAQKPWLNRPLGIIPHLKDLSMPSWQLFTTPPTLTPPELSAISITPEQAEMALIAAWGRHPVLMAGPAGSGKSLLCEVIHGLGSDPDLVVQKELWQRKQHTQKEEELANFWRPLIRPHHSITLQGLIGGGNPIRLGELARAHHGTLILDELLEFKQSVIEALREPMETTKLRLVRVSGYESYDCCFQLLATTNLCPCGDYVPKVPTRCRYSLTKCRSYSQKLTGPLVDRFQMLSFSHRWKGNRSVSIQCLKNTLDDMRGSFPAQKPDNALLTEAAFDIKNWPLLERKLMEQLQGSHRRYLSTLRVSQTIANLAGRMQPQVDDIEKALKYTVTPFAELQRWD